MHRRQQFVKRGTQKKARRQPSLSFILVLFLCAIVVVAHSNHFFVLLCSSSISPLVLVYLISSCHSDNFCYYFLLSWIRVKYFAISCLFVGARCRLHPLSLSIRCNCVLCTFCFFKLFSACVWYFLHFLWVFHAIFMKFSTQYMLHTTPSDQCC